ncbi:RagB/SusD family nutrient uptake outer membrane protein [Flavobacterium sp. 5]|uniref:RagB/SusD family nutrient uptake outer membrane protein n=1 Tax=Flavobacterium sp. 5 TaxID=2035199 RepID=UPI000C2C0B01|nr:RagB/SusD family nutrient uptake outer membrane protein [Flavobacterium sp. 5]PKB15515.1 putative outer membrane starch-binding protein [Flavobacterium sp. 5]
MKKYIFITVTSMALFSAIFVSCSDNFIERPIQYSIDSESYFNSKEDYQNALVGAYDLLQTTYNNVIMGEFASDNTLAGGGDATDVAGWQQIDDMIHTPVNENIKNTWDWMFAGVQRANYILEFKDKTDFEGKNQIIAEARFLRAYYHFELVKWFGGIPLNGDKRFAPGDETKIPRSSVAEVYASIESDLIYAADNLSADASVQGKVTKGAALALLGKAYLYDNKFPEAAIAFEKVIASSKYSLVTDYGSIFEMEGENGPESIFEVQYTDIEGASYVCKQCSEGNIAVGFSGVRDYVGPKYSSGWSFNVPTKETHDAFEIGDLRRDVSVLDIAAWATANSTPGHPVTYSKGNEDTGYFSQKYLPRTRRNEASNDLKLTNPNNYRAIRYADVLLMAAEALNRGGLDDAKALGYLNQVRDRAFGNTSHRISATGSGLTDAIWKERRVEFVGEGLRFFDLVRTGKAAAAISGFVVGKHELFPIPLEEIQFSNGNWKQNPGY